MLAFIKADLVMIIFAGILVACNIGFGISALEYMKKDDPAYPGNPGDDIGEAYIAGNAGAQWTSDEVESTRARILQLIHPDWKIKYKMGTARDLLGNGGKLGKGGTTENIMIRLAFHDCIPYVDSNDGWACDGCMNWSGMDSETPNPNDASHYYKFDPLNATDNKGLDGGRYAY